MTVAFKQGHFVVSQQGKKSCISRLLHTFMVENKVGLLPLRRPAHELDAIFEVAKPFWVSITGRNEYVELCQEEHLGPSTDKIL